MGTKVTTENCIDHGTIFDKIEAMGAEKNKDGTYTIVITGYYVPYREATWYEPSDGGYCEDVTVSVNGMDVELTEEEENKYNDILVETDDGSDAYWAKIEHEEDMRDS